MGNTKLMTEDARTEQLWLDLSRRLRSFIRTKIRGDAEVEDLLQTVFLRIHQNIQKVKTREKLEPWVFQIARNAIIDELRKKRTQSKYFQGANSTGESASMEMFDKHPPAIPNCFDGLIDELPEEQQRALVMYEIEGLSQKAIAKAESISLAAAKSRIQRGRKNLKTLIQECCELQFDRRGNIIDYQQQQKMKCCEDRKLQNQIAT